MKPLLQKDLESFLKRFDNFKEGELRSVEIVSPTLITVTLAGQDGGREFNWVSVVLEFSGVNDAKLLEDSKLSFVDMSDGISIVHEDGNFAFGIGECYNLSSVKNSLFQVISSSLKYEEREF